MYSPPCFLGSNRRWDRRLTQSLSPPVLPLLRLQSDLEATTERLTGYIEVADVSEIDVTQLKVSVGC